MFAAAVACVLAPLAARLAVKVGAVDIPDERKVHDRPVPRLGGLAVVAAIVTAFAWARWLSAERWQPSLHLMAGIGFGILPIVLVSITDDIRPVGARKKFLAHLAGASIATSLGISLAPVVHLFGSAIDIGWIRWPLSVLWIVGVTNAFNLIDGLDGLSTGLALIATVTMGAIFALIGQAEMIGVSLVLAGALLGFLPYNLHPARLFLGDTGATAIGFCLSAFALRGGSTVSSGFAALLPVFILGLPIADTLVAMLRRTLRRLEHHTGGVFVPDRDHIHHRLLALGIDHGRAVWTLYAAGLALAGAAFLSVFLNTRQAALIVTALLLAAIVGIKRLGYDEFAFIRRGTVLKIYELPAVKRGFFVVLIDVGVAFVAAYVAVGLKTDVWTVLAGTGPVVEIATLLAPVTVAIFWWRGMYRGSWRVAGLQDLTRVLVAEAIATPVGALLIELLSANQYALSLFGIYGVVSLLLTASLRASYVILEHTTLRSSHQGVPVLIYGAGRRGVAAVRELFQHPASGLRPIGFIDDDRANHGKVVSGLPVLGTGRELERALDRSGAGGILIASEKISSAQIERAADTCRRRHVNLFRLDIRVERVIEDEEQEVTVPHPERVSLPEARGVTIIALPGDAERGTGGQRCPSCAHASAHRSKARNAFERLKKERTLRRLYRCDTCGWRGWLMPMDFSNVVTTDRLSPIDLRALDSAVKQPASPFPPLQRN
jgi:UDP-GlcNAc:undecaprenyl-phosphate GlcNAc-1-phosphate transferase